MSCKTCKGKGSYMYDELHGKFCESCCEHPQYHIYIIDDRYSESNGKYCCGRCGVQFDTLAEAMLGIAPKGIPG